MGFVLGITLFISAIGLLFILGSYHVSGLAQWTLIFSPLLVAIYAAVLEEVLMRAILFRIIMESL
jgi:hypothetical protein